MAFWKRIRRRREPSPRSGPADSPPVVAGFVSSPYTGRTLHGKAVVRVGDPELFRQEDAMRDRARSGLDPEDESHAQSLVDLIGRYAAYGPSGPEADALTGEIRAIGRRLCEDGGKDRMKLIAFRVAVLGAGNPYATVRTMESFWNGICGWQV
jgi:hypothetical protein